MKAHENGVEYKQVGLGDNSIVKSRRITALPGLALGRVRGWTGMRWFRQPELYEGANESCSVLAKPWAAFTCS